MKGIRLLVFVSGLLAGCATLGQNNLDWIPIGPEFPPTKVKDLEIVSGRRADITRPYGNLGLLRIKNVKPQRDSILMGIEKGKTKGPMLYSSGSTTALKTAQPTRGSRWLFMPSSTWTI